MITFILIVLFAVCAKEYIQSIMNDDNEQD